MREWIECIYKSLVAGKRAKKAEIQREPEIPDKKMMQFQIHKHL
jgi:hypothetical protein